MDLIKNIIPQVIENISGRKPETQNKIQRVWQSILGKEADRARIVGLKDGVLTVQVGSPARRFHLNAKKRKTLKLIQEEIPDIQNIVFKIGKE